MGKLKFLFLEISSGVITDILGQPWRIFFRVDMKCPHEMIQYDFFNLIKTKKKSIEIPPPHGVTVIINRS